MPALCSIAVNGPGIVVALKQEVAVAGVDNGAESFLKHNVADVGLVVACRAACILAEFPSEKHIAVGGNVAGVGLPVLASACGEQFFAVCKETEIVVVLFAADFVFKADALI